MQRMDQKPHSQDGVQQQSQKLDLIKRELQKYRELKKSPSFSNHLSSKQLQNCSDIEKRKKIFTYINSNQLVSDQLSISQLSIPQSTRNFQEQQQFIQNRQQEEYQEKQSEFFQQPRYFASNQRIENQEGITNRNKSMEGYVQGLSENNKSTGDQKSNYISKTNNKEYFREITLADVQNFDMENQKVCFNEETSCQQQQAGFNRQNSQGQFQESQLIKEDCQPFVRGSTNCQQYQDAHQDSFGEENFDNQDNDENEQLTFEDLRVKHQGVYCFKDQSNQDLSEVSKNSKNKKNLILNNLEENNNHQSSYGSTLISSGRNEYEKIQLTLQYSQLQKNQQQSFMTSQNSLTSQVSQKLQSVSSGGKLNKLSSSSSSQQIPYFKECISTTLNSKQQLSSNHTISSNNKINSKDSQTFIECSIQPRNLNIHPEFQEKLSSPKMGALQLEGRPSQKDLQNTSNSKLQKPINNLTQRNNKEKLLPSTCTQNSMSRVASSSVSNTITSPPVSPKSNIPIQRQNKQFFQSEIKRISGVSAPISPKNNSRTSSKVEGKGIVNKENKQKEATDSQNKQQLDFNDSNKQNKNNSILQEKSHTTKNIRNTFSTNQPYFKSIRGVGDKTPPKNKTIGQSNNSLINKTSNGNSLLNIQENKKESTPIIGSSAPAKPFSTEQNNINISKKQQDLVTEEIQNQQKHTILERKLIEEQDRWKEIGSQMVMAYEELNQNFKLLVQQKKQQDKMLQQLVHGLSQKDVLDKSLQSFNKLDDEISLPSQRGNESNRYNNEQEEEEQEIQMMEVISEIQGKLFKKFDKHDSIQIQNLLNAFSKSEKQNKTLQTKQKNIQKIVNVQIKESSSLADQIIHLRTQLDKACISMMKNQKESSSQFQSMLQMINATKNNALLSPNAQSLIIHEESFHPNVAQSFIKQLEQKDYFTIGSTFSPINSRINLSNAEIFTNQKQSLQQNNYNIHDQGDLSDNLPVSIFSNGNQNQKIPQTTSYIQFNNHPDASYISKQEDLNVNKNFTPILSQLQEYNHKQNDSFEIVSPIRNQSVPFFGEMMKNQRMPQGFQE